ncbi:Isoquinoline 1-oxidoreductase subunit alpha [Gluconacetobacter sp. SXCC-1]|uniref:(2Fe-2S)-binding protein n=1 Tax=Komagataeibacter rhaeticus TaxID=215221 RepID=UPI000207FB6C|nr:(2Fe-2S)-binding protein [Komagataeibacter rhaeticus]ATU74116.1 (2Fe-2S)-binding protein [Komagataeibacter xylinus]EGG78080.1 Isoquinoline 1-oxidoreductase subunit alpha [Gluconacetobacter sp. SXCC-1]WPP21175.1 (2Fe-2S)-binding protein [Komagataeibacter rhaeticus]
MADSVFLTVNGERHEIHAAPDTPLLTVLRNDLRLNGPKFGCGLGECGACTVLLDGRAARSCVIRLDTAAACTSIVTLEGLSPDGSDPVQRAFVKAQAAQCGYCLNGMVMTLRAFLDAVDHPDRAALKEALRYNLCRCGTHVEIMKAACIAAGLSEGEP